MEKLLATFCKKYLQKTNREKLNITWTCSARVDTLDEDMIKKMSQCGLKGIYLGIETGSNRMQKIIKKNLHIERVWDIIECLIKYKIGVICSFIINFPEETLDDLNETLNTVRIAMEKGVYTCQTHKLTMLPGTEMFEKYKKDLELDCSFNSSFIKDVSNPLCKDIIKNNPYIFPQYYNLKSHSSNEYEHVNVFMQYIYILLYKKLKTTYSLLMNYYDNSLIKIYKDFQKINLKSHIFTQPVSNLMAQDQKEIANKLLPEFENFIKNKDFNDMTGLIRETFRFEYDIQKFLNNYDERI